MSKLVFLSKVAVVFFTILINNYSNKVDEKITKFQDDKINVIFQNNDGITAAKSKKYKLTIENLSGTKSVEEFTLGEMSRRKILAISIGSKVYVDNGYKLNTLVGGKEPNKNDPFMVVMLRDKNQTINLNEEVNTSESTVLINAQKSAEKLKLDTSLKPEIFVTGNIATVYYKDGSGKIKAAFDCDKKNGNVKNIDDRRKNDDQGPVKTSEKEGAKKLKGLLGR